MNIEKSYFDTPINGNRRQEDYVNGTFGSSPRVSASAKNDNHQVANTANTNKNMRTDIAYKEDAQKEADIQEMMDLLSRYSGKSDVVATERSLRKKSLFQIEQMLTEVKDEVQNGEEDDKGIVATICEGVAHVCRHGFKKKDLHSSLHAKNAKHSLFTNVDTHHDLNNGLNGLNALAKAAKDKTAIEGGVA